MSYKLKKSLLALSLMATVGTAVAQNGSNSPYTRYGFGLLNDRAQGFNKGMGGVALGMRSANQINFQNPASYSAVDSLTFLFDLGASFQNANLSADGHKVNARNTSVDYPNMSFRGWRNVGFSVGLMPYSTVGYEFSDKKTLPDNDGFGEKVATTSYSGDGGLHQVYLGVGWQPFRRFSIGTNLSYLWGDYSHQTKVLFSENSIQPLVRNYSADISTYKVDFGVQYEQLISKKDLLTLGATYSLGHGIDSKAKFINQILSSNGAVESADTISASKAFELPHSFGVGVAWNHNNRWNVGVDYTYELWSRVKFPTLTEENGALQYKSAKGAFNDRHKITLGGEYTPNPMGIHYRDHIRYRAGVSYGTSYTKVNGVDGADNYCVSLGVGLPIANLLNNRSILSVAAQWEHVKPSVSHQITENYLRICIGITFNERWFTKWKVE